MSREDHERRRVRREAARGTVRRRRRDGHEETALTGDSARRIKIETSFLDRSRRTSFFSDPSQSQRRIVRQERTRRNSPSRRRNHQHLRRRRRSKPSRLKSSTSSRNIEEIPTLTSNPSPQETILDSSFGRSPSFLSPNPSRNELAPLLPPPPPLPTHLPSLSHQDTLFPILPLQPPSSRRLGLSKPRPSNVGSLKSPSPSTSRSGSTSSSSTEPTSLPSHSVDC